MIGILTFHRSHNYGSVLQSYALQQWLKKHGLDSEIIDLYMASSKEMYKILPEMKTLKNVARNLVFLYHYRELKKKWDKYKYFQEHILRLSEKQYSDLPDLKKEHFSYSTYLTGSDQIWNTACRDFSWAYYMEFIDKGNFVSYAPSFGSKGKEEQRLDNKRIASDIEKYSAISVRDEGSADFIEEISGKRPEVTIDPTLLLSKGDWDSLLFKMEKPDLRKKLPPRYIFFYSLKRAPIDYEMIRKIRNKYHLPVVITEIRNQKDITGEFTKIWDAGPGDFLSLIKHADLVVTSSFHGTVFSVIFEKKFFSINGMNDNRISNLLRGTGLEMCSIDETSTLPLMENINIDYIVAKKKLTQMVSHSEDFLLNALKGEKHGNM